MALAAGLAVGAAGLVVAFYTALLAVFLREFWNAEVPGGIEFLGIRVDRDWRIFFPAEIALVVACMIVAGEQFLEAWRGNPKDGNKGTSRS